MEPRSIQKLIRKLLACYKETDAWSELQGIIDQLPPNLLNHPINANGETILHAIACEALNSMPLELLLSRGANPNVTTVDGHTPLHFAVLGKQIMSIRSLIQWGAHPNATNIAGHTPIDLAYQSENWFCLKVLLEEWGKRAAYSTHLLDPPPEELCDEVERQLEVTNMLANKTNHGLTWCQSDLKKERPHDFYRLTSMALHQAIEQRDTDTLKALLAIGTDVQNDDLLYNSPLEHAIEKLHFSAIPVLIKYGAQSPLELTLLLNQPTTQILRWLCERQFFDFYDLLDMAEIALTESNCWPGLRYLLTTSPEIPKALLKQSASHPIHPLPLFWILNELVDHFMALRFKNHFQITAQTFAEAELGLDGELLDRFVAMTKNPMEIHLLDWKESIQIGLDHTLLSAALFGVEQLRIHLADSKNDGSCFNTQNEQGLKPLQSAVLSGDLTTLQILIDALKKSHYLSWSLKEACSLLELRLSVCTEQGIYPNNDSTYWWLLTNKVLPFFVEKYPELDGFSEKKLFSTLADFFQPHLLSEEILNWLIEAIDDSRADRVAFYVQKLQTVNEQHPLNIQKLIPPVMLNQGDPQKLTLLHHMATQANRNRIMFALLRAGANPLAKTKNGQTALHLAASHNQIQCFSLLLNHGTPIDATDLFETTAFEIIALEGNPAGMEILIRHGAQLPILQENDPLSPFIQNVLRKQLAGLFYFLLEHGAIFHPSHLADYPVLKFEWLLFWTEKIGQTISPEMPALYSTEQIEQAVKTHCARHTELRSEENTLKEGLLKLLLPSNEEKLDEHSTHCSQYWEKFLPSEDLEWFEKIKKTSLLAFLQTAHPPGKIHLFKLLLMHHHENGTLEEQLNALEEKTLNTLLHLAAQQGDPWVLKILLKLHGNQFEQHSVGRKHALNSCANQACLQVLLSSTHVHLHQFLGIEQPADSGTLLHYAILVGHEDTAKRLLELGAPLDTPTQLFSYTPLHTATLTHQSKTVDLLLEYGADIHAKTTHHHTPIHFATRAPDLRLLQTFLQRNVNLNTHAAHFSLSTFYQPVYPPNESPETLRLILKHKDPETIGKKDNIPEAMMATILGDPKFFNSDHERPTRGKTELLRVFLETHPSTVVRLYHYLISQQLEIPEDSAFIIQSWIASHLIDQSLPAITEKDLHSMMEQYVREAALPLLPTDSIQNIAQALQNQHTSHEKTVNKKYVELWKKVLSFEQREYLNASVAAGSASLITLMENRWSLVNPEPSASLPVSTETLRCLIADLKANHQLETALKQTNEAGHTAFHFASIQGDLNALQILLEAGADPLATDKRGHTALQLVEANRIQSENNPSLSEQIMVRKKTDNTNFWLTQTLSNWLLTKPKTVFTQTADEFQATVSKSLGGDPPASVEIVEAITQATLSKIEPVLLAYQAYRQRIPVSRSSGVTVLNPAPQSFSQIAKYLWIQTPHEAEATLAHPSWKP